MVTALALPLFLLGAVASRNLAAEADNLISKIKQRLKALAARNAWRFLELQFRLTSGIHICVAQPSDWFIYNEVFVNADYDEAILKAVELTHSGTIKVLDLGANVGFFALRLLHVLSMLSAANPRECECICIESNPSTARVLERRLNKNSGRSKVRIVHGLVGSRSGTAFISDGSFSGNNTITGTQKGGRIRVQYVDVEALTATWDSVTLIKCDVEGAEELFVTNYPELLLKTQVVVVELHRSLCNTNKVIECLLRAGFDSRRLLSAYHENLRLELFWKSQPTAAHS